MESESQPHVNEINDDREKWVMKVTKRKKSSVFGLTAAAVLLAITAGCGGNAGVKEMGAAAGQEKSAAAAAVKQVDVQFALDTAATGSPQSRVAVEQGYFGKNGVQAKTFDFPYGIDTLNALLVDRADVGSAADYALLNSLGKGDMVILGTLSRANEVSAKNSVLLVRSGINSEQDLAGKKLGVARGTVFEYVWAKYLEKLGIPKDKVTYVNYSSPDEALVALKRGQMDAIWASGAVREKLKEVEGVKELVDSSKTGVYVKAFLVARRSFVEQHPDAAAGTLKALKEATDYIGGHKQETAQLLFDKIKLPQAGVLKDLEAASYVVGFTQEDYEHLSEMQKWLQDQGILKGSYDLKSKINVEPLKKALPESVTYKP